MGFLRRHFTGGVGVDDVIALDAAPLVPAALGGLHLPMGGVRAAVDAGNEAVGLTGVHAVGDGLRQRGFLLIQRVVQAVVQPAVNNDDLVICHYSASFTSRMA